MNAAAPEVVWIEAKPRDAATAQKVAVLLAGGGQDAPYRHPMDGRQYRAGVVSRPLFSAQIGFDETGWTGSTRPQTSVVGFSTADPALRASLAGLIWKDAEVAIDAGPEGTAAARILTGKVKDAEFTAAGMSLTIVDLSERLEQPLAASRFAGSGGVEGPAEAAGRIKRRSFGYVFDVEGRLIDAANSIYEFGDPAFPLSAWSDLRDKGRSGPFTVLAWQGSIAATFAALQASQPARGGGVVAPSIACAKWWTRPSAPLAADFIGSAGTGGSMQAAAIADAISRTASGPTVEALAEGCDLRPGVAGIHIASEQESFAQAIDRLLYGLSLFWVPQPAGTIAIRPFAFTTGAAPLQGVFKGRSRTHPPHRERRVGFQRNERVHSESEIAGILLDELTDGDGDLAREDLLNAHQEWREVGDADGTRPQDNATVGAPSGTPVGDRTADDVVEAIDEQFSTLAATQAGIDNARGRIDAAQSDIADLIETYGVTVDANAAKDLAVAARDVAQEANSGAQSAASLAEDQAASASADRAAVAEDRQLVATYRQNTLDAEGRVDSKAAVVDQKTAIATAQASAAQQSARVAAQIGYGYLNTDPAFADYPLQDYGNTGNNPPSNAWRDTSFFWEGATRQPGRVGPYAYDLNSVAGHRGKSASSDPSPSNGLGQMGPGWYVFECDAEIISGAFETTAPQFAVQMFAANGTYLGASFVGQLRNLTPIGMPAGPGSAGQYRRYRVLFQNPHNSASGQIDAYWWQGEAANRIRYHLIGIRPASDAEIKAQTALPALEASVSSLSQAYTDQDTQLATLETEVQTQGASVTEHASAIDDIEGSAAFLEVLVEASGGDPAIFRMLAGKNGSELILAGQRVLVLNPNGSGGYTEVARYENGKARLSDAIIRRLRVPPLPTSEIVHDVQLKPLRLIGNDGEPCYYQGGASYGANPEDIRPVDTSSLPALPAGQSYDVRATQIGPAFFVPYIKIISSGGAQTTRDSAAGADQGAVDPRWQTNKPVAEDAYDGKYEFTFAGTIPRVSQEIYQNEVQQGGYKEIRYPGDFGETIYEATYSGTFTLKAKTAAGQWVTLGSVTVTMNRTSSTNNPMSLPFNRVETVQSSADLGSGAGQFGIQPSDGGVITSFGRVRFVTQAASATTSVQSPLAFYVYPPVYQE